MSGNEQDTSKEDKTYSINQDETSKPLFSDEENDSNSNEIGSFDHVARQAESDDSEAEIVENDKEIEPSENEEKDVDEEEEVIEEEDEEDAVKHDDSKDVDAASVDDVAQQKADLSSKKKANQSDDRFVKLSCASI